MNDYRDTIDEINELIRAGKGDAARAKLDKVCRNLPPPRIAFALAELAKRLGQPGLAVRLLSPIVRPPGSRELAGTPYEQAEYALNLMRLGGRAEAEKILAKIDSKKYPVAALYRAWGSGIQWDYGSAIAPFKEYLAWKDAPVYQRLVAKVNLCQALIVEERFSDPDLKLEELIAVTGEKNHKLLYAHLHELAAHSAILKEDFSGARAWLLKAEKEISGAGGFDALFVKKWRMVVELATDKNSAQGKVHNEEVRHEAVRLKHWETVRDCDRALALWGGDNRAAERVLFGTPFEAYRKRLLLRLTERFRPPGTFDWRLGDAKGEAEVLNLASGEIEGAKGEIKVGQAVHRLLTAVASDHYRPFPLVSIFSAVYPDENYHPVTSTMRVHRVIQRFRAWAKEINLPIEIEYHPEGYSLSADRPLVIRHELDNSAPSREKVWVDKVRDLSKGHPFTRAEVEKWLDISQTSAHRFLKQASGDGFFQAKGSGNAKKYVWTVAKKLAA